MISPETPSLIGKVFRELFGGRDPTVDNGLKKFGELYAVPCGIIRFAKEHPAGFCGSVSTPVREVITQVQRRPDDEVWNGNLRDGIHDLLRLIRVESSGPAVYGLLDSPSLGPMGSGSTLRAVFSLGMAAFP